MGACISDENPTPSDEPPINRPSTDTLETLAYQQHPLPGTHGARRNQRQKLNAMSFTSIRPSILDQASSHGIVPSHTTTSTRGREHRTISTIALPPDPTVSRGPLGALDMTPAAAEGHRAIGVEGGLPVRPAAAVQGGDVSPPPCTATCATLSLEAPTHVSAPPALPDDLRLDSNVGFGPLEISCID